MGWRVLAAALLLHLAPARAALEIPPPPRDYVYDQTGTISSDTRSRLFDLLSAEDRRSGNQVVVAVFPSLVGEDLVDYTNRLFKAWNPGQKGKDNGVVIAFYLQDRKVRFEVGYGLEPILTDALSRRIIETEIVPAFRQGDFNTGIYNAAARTVQVITDPNAAPAGNPGPRGQVVRISSGAFFLILLFLFLFLRGLSRATSFSRYGRSTYYRRRGGGFLPGMILGGLLGSGRRRSGWGGGGGGFGGGGFGGGGFGGGGGSSGGGGASGSW